MEPNGEPDIPFELPDSEPAAEPVRGELVPMNGDLVSVVGPGGPDDALERVEAYATALTDFVKAHELTLEMEDGSHYLLSPAWEALGQLTGYFAVVQEVTPIPQGWRARAVVHQPARGDTPVTAREAICTRQEFGRERKPDSEIHAMAQTRACRNALRAALSIIPNTAGFDSTPLEERPASPRQRALLFAILKRLDRLDPKGRDGWKNWVTDRTLRRFGKRISGLNREQMRSVIDAMQQRADELAELPKEDRAAAFEPTDDELAEGRMEFS